MKTKFIFITGGVVSSLGKGIIGSSIGQLLKKQGLKVTMQKFDPYINTEPGLLNPTQHGEVFVTSDGAETDLDLGHYERFLDENLNNLSAVTSGQIYLEVINREKEGYYKGQTLQVIPHITDVIKEKLTQIAFKTDADIVITEIGGTVGDIESLPFLEAIRQARIDFGYHNTLYIHTTLVPYIKAAKEIKTKPTQHSAKQLMNLGIYPDMLVLRSEYELGEEIKNKIGTFTGIQSNKIFESIDVDVVYEMILNLNKQEIEKHIFDHFKIGKTKKSDLKDWQDLINKMKDTHHKAKVMVVGNYVSYKDAYLSVEEALKHAGYQLDTTIEFKWINPNKVNLNAFEKELLEVDGIVVPGGYGNEGVSKKIEIIEMARRKGIPFLGICLGMQLTAIEIVKNIGNIKDATSREFNNSTNTPIIERIKNENIKNHIVGSYQVELKKDSLIYDIFKQNIIEERFRHHYEFNDVYKKTIEEAGFVISGYNKQTNSVSVIEYKDHPFFIAVQFHPEFISRPLRPHPLFLRFIEVIKK